MPVGTLRAQAARGAESQRPVIDPPLRQPHQGSRARRAHGETRRETQLIGAGQPITTDVDAGDGPKQSGVLVGGRSVDGRDCSICLLILQFDEGAADGGGPGELQGRNGGTRVLDVPGQLLRCQLADDDDDQRRQIARSSPAITLVRAPKGPPVLDHGDQARKGRRVCEAVSVEDDDDTRARRTSGGEAARHPPVHGSTRAASRSVNDGIAPCGSR